MSITNNQIDEKWKISDVIFLLVSLILCLFCLWYICAFIKNKAWDLLESDMASEVILGNLLNKEKSILSPNWYYSTELRVLNTQLVYAPLFSLTDSWENVHVYGDYTMFAILLACVYYFCWQMNITKFTPLVFTGILLPLSEDYLIYYLMNALYIPYTCIILVILASGIKYARNNKKLILLLSCVISLLAGLGGARMTLMLYIPLMLTVSVLLAANYFHLLEQTDTFFFRQLFLFSLINTIFDGVGFLLNKYWLPRKYYFESWSTLSLRHFRQDKIANLFNGIQGMFGYFEDSAAVPELLLKMISVLLILLVILCLIWCLFRKKAIKSSHLFFVLFFLCGFISVTAMYAFTNMDYTNRHLFPLFSLFFVIIVLGAVNIPTLKSVGSICPILAIGMMLIGSHNVLSQYRDADWASVKKDMVEWLVNNDYYAGYATFWNANVMTELSNGRIDMYDWGEGGEAGIGMEKISNVNTVYKWLQLVSHAEAVPSGKVFMLFTTEERDLCRWKYGLQEEDIVWKNDWYVIYGYESYDEMIRHITDYQYVFEGVGIKGGEDINGERIINGGGISSGPDIYLYKGIYEICIEGLNLMNLQFEIKCDQTDSILVQSVVNDESSIFMTVEVLKPSDHVEVIIMNHGDENVILTAMTIEKTE